MTTTIDINLGLWVENNKVVLFDRDSDLKRALINVDAPGNPIRTSLFLLLWEQIDTLQPGQRKKIRLPEVISHTFSNGKECRDYELIKCIHTAFSTETLHPDVFLSVRYDTEKEDSYVTVDIMRS